MYLTKDRADEIIETLKIDMLNSFKDKLLFLPDLLIDSDWAFVIKSHSLVEALMNDLVSVHIDNPSLVDIISRLPLHGDHVSKMGFAKKLQIVTASEVRFIVSLSELRNVLVHKFEHIDFKFDVYVSKLNKEQFKNLNFALQVSAGQHELYKVNRGDTGFKIKLGYWNALYHLIINLIEKIQVKRALLESDREAIITSMDLIRDMFKEE